MNVKLKGGGRGGGCKKKDRKKGSSGLGKTYTTIRRIFSKVRRKEGKSKRRNKANAYLTKEIEGGSKEGD